MGERGRPIVDAAKAAFLDGVSTALLAAAVVLVVAAVVVYVRSPRPPKA